MGLGFREIFLANLIEDHERIYYQNEATEAS